MLEARFLLPGDCLWKTDLLRTTPVSRQRQFPARGTRRCKRPTKWSRRRSTSKFSRLSGLDSAPCRCPDRKLGPHCQLPELSVRFFAPAASFPCAAPYDELVNRLVEL